MKQYCVYLLILFLTFSNLFEMECKKNRLKSRKNSHLFMKAMTRANLYKPDKSKKIKAKKVEYDPDLILQKNENLKIEISDWLRISSPVFKNQKKFPSLQLPDGSEAKINIDDGYFRINDFFVPNQKNGPPSNEHFWFRMTGRNLYYSMNQEDINVLGSIPVKALKNIQPLKGYSNEPLCFKIVDDDMNDWKLCANSFLSKADWVCKIKEKLGIVEPDCKKLILADSEITVLTKKVTQPIILVPQPGRICNENWDYMRHGDNWECTCSEGKEQSPIDLPLPKNAIKSEARPLFEYNEVEPNFIEEEDNHTVNKNLKIRLVDAVLKISNKNFGKVVTLDGSVYTAEDIIFHTPSEHTIKGKRYDMEMQIIHYGQTKGDTAKQVILSFLFEKKPGVYNKFIDDVDFFNLPNPSSKERDIINSLYIPKIFYTSESDDLPVMKFFSFFTYQGSLTQPPCSERTIVYVASNPIPLGTSAITLFQESARIPDVVDANGNVVMNTAGPQNNRNIKPLNDRKVYHYDHTEACGPDSPERKKPKTDGHYEKVIKRHTEYFYVNGEKPSGLPGAYVVSESEAKGLVKNS